MAENASVKSASRTSHWASVPRKAERFPGSTSLSSTSETNSAPQTVRRRRRSCDAPEVCCSLRRLPAAVLRFVRAAARRFPCARAQRRRRILTVIGSSSLGFRFGTVYAAASPLMPARRKRAARWRLLQSFDIVGKEIFQNTLSVSVRGILQLRVELRAEDGARLVRKHLHTAIFPGSE